MKLQLDHVVVAARRLEDGVAWCEAEMGVTPGPGGRHVFMGTHNRLLHIASPLFPRAYLEIIAIDPYGVSPGRPRWFDLDRPVMKAALQSGPKLVHWVARTDELAKLCDAVRAAGIDCGEVVPAQRNTPQGMLSWQITVRSTGDRLFGGAMPALIEWAGVHPTEAMASSGIRLESVQLAGLPAAMVDWLGPGIAVVDADGPAAPPIALTLATPRGCVRLESIREGG